MRAGTTPEYVRLWMHLPPSLRRVVRYALTFYRRARFGWRGVTVTVADTTFLISHASGSEFRRARNFAAGEPELLEAFRAAARGARVVLDVGAATGLYTILAARTNSSARVYAFEPHSNNREALNTNLHLNQIENVTVSNMALGDTPGEAFLEHRGDRQIAGLGTHRIKLSPDAGLPRVTIATIDLLVAQGEVEPPDVIKIDVEGFEVRVVRGMQETLRRSRPVVLLELHPREIAELGDDPDDLHALLTEAGYRRELLREEPRRLHLRYAAA